jgi:hypothetical protein
MSKNKITLSEYAKKHNPVLTRRNKKMSESYLYRLIRDDIKGVSTREIWFKYILEGDKDHIFIEL